MTNTILRFTPEIESSLKFLTPRQHLECLLFFDALLRDPELLESLTIVWKDGTDTELAVLIVELLKDEFDDDDLGRVFESFVAFVNSVAEVMLNATAKTLSIPVTVNLFKKISHTFLEFQEPWETLIGKEYFVAFAKYYNGVEDTLTVEQKLMVYYLLARSAEELDLAKDNDLTIMNSALAILDSLSYEA